VARSIVFFGMMGAGKSTVARIIAGRLGREFVDTDREVARRADMTILDIFDAEGEEGFRTREREVVADLAGRDDLVVAVGGGVVLDERNVDVLAASGVLVRLDAPVEVLTERLLRRGDPDPADIRPLLEQHDPREEFTRIAAEREDRYAAVAAITLDATDHPEAVADTALEALADRGDVLRTDEVRRTVP
jgi:shikimate kinase